MIDIVEVLIMENFALKSDKRKQLESKNTHSKEQMPEQQPNAAPPPVEEVHADGTVENYPQWELPNDAKMRLGKGGMRGIQFSPDGTQLAVRSTIGVWLYDVETCKEISLFPEIKGVFVFSADGRFLTNEEGVWEIATRRRISKHIPLPDVESAWFLKDRKTFVSLGEAKDTISILNIETRQVTTTKIGERPGYAHLENYALTEDKIAIGSRNGLLELWDISTGKKLSTLRNPTNKRVHFRMGVTPDNHSTSLALSPDGTILASGNLDGTVQIWDAITGEELILLYKKMDKVKMLFHSPDGQLHTHEPWEKDNISRPTTLEFSPDGKLLVIGNMNSSIQVWNVTTSELVTSFTGHTSNVNRLAFSPDGNTLASGSTDGTVRFWNIKTKEPYQNGIAGHAWVSKASFIKNNSKLASVSSEGIVTVWDLKTSQKTTNKTKKTLEVPRFWNMYVSLEFSPDGTNLLTQGLEDDSSKPNFDNFVLRFTDVNTGLDVKTFPESDGRIFSPDGKTVAGRGGNKIYLLNTETGEKNQIITSDHDEDSDERMPHVRAIIFSPDGKQIVSGTMGGKVQIWDVETGDELSSYFEEQPPEGSSYREPILNLAFSSDGSLLAVGSTKRIRFIGRSEHKQFKEITYNKKGSGVAFIFSPDNTTLIVGLRGGKMELWNISTGDKLTTFDRHSVSVQNLMFSPDNKTLMSVGIGTILLWDWEKVITNASKEEQDHVSDGDLLTKEQTTDNVLKFVERSSPIAKSSSHALTLAEVYLANEWYDEALERYKRNLYITTSETFPTPKGEFNVTSSPSLERKLFTEINRARKNVKDKDGFANMMNKLIDIAPDRMNIQLNSHIILAKFYGANGILEKAEEHIQKSESIIDNIPSENIEIRIYGNIGVAEYYREIGMFEKVETYIQETESVIEHLPSDMLRTYIRANFALAEYYQEFEQFDKSEGHIRKTGFITEDAWMVLGPFDNTEGIGHDTAYIPEDRTEIDLTAKYDGLNGKVRWKQHTDTELDGYIHLGEDNVNWQVSYAFTSVTSPDERKVEIRFDSDDQGKVWLNGEEVFSHTKAFMAIVDTYTIPVILKQGKNSILTKVCNEKSGWAFFMRITDSDGNPFSDLKFGNP